MGIHSSMNVQLTCLEKFFWLGTFVVKSFQRRLKKWHFKD